MDGGKGCYTPNIMDTIGLEVWINLKHNKKERQYGTFVSKLTMSATPSCIRSVGMEGESTCGKI